MRYFWMVACLATACTSPATRSHASPVDAVAKGPDVGSPDTTATDITVTDATADVLHCPHDPVDAAVAAPADVPAADVAEEEGENLPACATGPACGWSRGIANGPAAVSKTRSHATAPACRPR